MKFVKEFYHMKQLNNEDLSHGFFFLFINYSSKFINCPFALLSLFVDKGIELCLFFQLNALKTYQFDNNGNGLFLQQPHLLCWIIISVNTSRDYAH